MVFIVFCFKQKTAYEMRISDWSSDVCSSDLDNPVVAGGGARHVVAAAPYGDLQIVVAGEMHGRDHVGAPDASSDQARAPVNGTIPDCTGDVVVGVACSDQPASEPVALRDGWLPAPVADFRGRRCRHRALLSSGGHSGPRRTAAV